MTILRQHSWRLDELVIDDGCWCIYMNQKHEGIPLLQAFLRSEVPVGILLDFLEDNIDILLLDLKYNINYKHHNPLLPPVHTKLIEELRYTYKDITLLFDKNSPLFNIS